VTYTVSVLVTVDVGSDRTVGWVVMDRQPLKRRKALKKIISLKREYRQAAGAMPIARSDKIKDEFCIWFWGVTTKSSPLRRNLDFLISPWYAKRPALLFSCVSQRGAKALTFERCKATTLHVLRRCKAGTPYLHCEKRLATSNLALRFLKP
jgi:hypothetical protein